MTCAEMSPGSHLGMGIALLITIFAIAGILIGWVEALYLLALKNTAPDPRPECTCDAEPDSPCPLFAWLERHPV